MGSRDRENIKSRSEGGLWVCICVIGKMVVSIKIEKCEMLRLVSLV